MSLFSEEFKTELRTIVMDAIREVIIEKADRKAPLNIEDASIEFKKSPQVIRGMARRGEIRGRKIGGEWYFDREELYEDLMGGKRVGRRKNNRSN